MDKRADLVKYIFSKYLETTKDFLSENAVVGSLILAILCACAGFSLTAEASGENIKWEKVVSVVYVKEGDTVWSIALDYYSDQYEDIGELVTEIKYCNGVSDNIRIGQRLFVPHYRRIQEAEQDSIQIGGGKK